METGTRGQGGDRTLVIDRSAESVVLDQLEALRQEGYAFTAISEERGQVDFGGGTATVIIDPIDGSLNAKRGIPHHALSAAVAAGATMGMWSSDSCTTLEHPRNGGPVVAPGPGWVARHSIRRSASAEAGTAGWRFWGSNRPTRAGWRLRSTRWSARPTGCEPWARSPPPCARWRRRGLTGWCRSDALGGVDCAAGQLIVREAGGVVSFPWCDEPLGAPLDAVPSSPVVAARSLETLRELESIPSREAAPR